MPRELPRLVYDGAGAIALVREAWPRPTDYRDFIQWEESMKTLALGLAGAAVLMMTSWPASARSCNEVAAACLKVAIKGGYNEAEWRQKCYEPKRMADCRRTGRYHAPSGKIWPAEQK